MQAWLGGAKARLKQASQRTSDDAFSGPKDTSALALTLRLGIPQETKSVAGRQAAYFERRRAEMAQAQGGGAVLPSGVPATGAPPAIAPPSAVPQISLDVIGLQYLLNRAAAKSNVAIAQLALPAPCGNQQLLALPAPGDDTRPEAAEQQAAYMQRGFPAASTQPVRVAEQAVHRTNKRPQPMAAMMMSAFDDDPSAPCGMIGHAAHEPLMPLPRLRVAVPNAPPATVVAPPTAAERVPVLVVTLDESNFSTPPDSHWPPDPVADADKALDASVVALIDDSGTGMDVDVIPSAAAAAFIPHTDIAAFDTAAHAHRHAVRKGFAADLLSLGFTDDDDDDAIGGDCSPRVAPLHVHMHNPHGAGGAAEKAAAAACNGKEDDDDISLPVVTVAEANATVAALSELLNGEEVARPPPAVLPQLHALVPLAAPQDAVGGGDIVMDCEAADTVAAAAAAEAAEEPALPSGEPPPDVTLPPLPERPTRGKRMVAQALQHAGAQAPAQIQDGGAAEVGMLESYTLQMHATLAMVHSAA